MKKFLHLPFESAEAPRSLDQRILAAAALRANRSRRIRRSVRLILPTAAAAAALMTGITFYTLNSTSQPITPREELNPADMLALADMTALEQSNYALTAMSEVYFSEENTFI